MRWSISKLVILGLLIAIPPAVAEPAPTLDWTRNFPGTRTSGITEWTGAYEGGSCTGVNNARFDWFTNTVWAAYTDGTITEPGSEESIGVIVKLNPNSGSIIGADSRSTDDFNVAACGVAPDQRGRVYSLIGPCDDTNQMPSRVYGINQLTVLEEFELTQVCAGEGVGTVTTGLNHIAVDWAPNPDDTATRFGFVTLVSDRGREVNWESFEDTGFSQVCTGTNPGGGGGGIGSQEIFLNDGTITPRYWRHDSAGLMHVRTFSDCSETTTTAAQKGGGPCITWNATIDCFEQEINPGNPKGITRRQHDPTDTTTAVTVLSTDTNAAVNMPDPVDDGLAASIVSLHNVVVDSEGGLIMCGITQEFFGSATQYSFLAKWATAFNDEPVWNITINQNTFQTEGCDLGPTGAVTWNGASNPLATTTAMVRYYCCASAGQNRSTLTYAQIDESGGGGPITGGNPIANAKNFCSDAWGFDCGMAFTFGIVAFGATVFYRKGMPLMIIAVLCLCLIGFAFIIGMTPTWFMLLVAFLIIAVAGTKLFGSGGEENE